ncbi:MAG: hypothetical protein WCT49_04105 [Candidatus Paceibacterota bacterium]|jgi:hypothetical protein|nr:hypothetical protein [Candidatus Paceibacterota bacterium]
MKNLNISRNFLSGVLSLFMLFVFAYAFSSSFFSFAKEAEAQTPCSGACLVSGCAGFLPAYGTCLNQSGQPSGLWCCSSTPAPTGSATSNGGGLVQCGKGNDPMECNFQAFIDLLQRIMNFLLFVLAVPLAAISFAWAGWLYLSAAGNEGNIKQAHEIFGTVALGLCIALAAWLIVHAIVKGLGVSTTYNFLGG